MKKAFTLSEALVTLAIIGVLAAILIPVINNVKPDKDKITYKKALYSLEAAVSNATDNLEYEFAKNANAYWKDANATGTHSFCNEMAKALRTSGTVNCSTTKASSYDNPNFITIDGIRYWGLEGDFSSSDTKTIYVDRQLTDREISAIANQRVGKDAVGLKIDVRYDGNVTVPTSAYENEIIKNGMTLQK